VPSPLCPLSGQRVFVARHHGMVGSAVLRRLESVDCTLLTAKRNDADLTRLSEVGAWFNVTKPNAVFLAAAKVGGTPRKLMDRTWLHDLG